jgi:acyl-CoA thioester hydrolase
MLTREITHRIAYYETDTMGYVHHSNYIRLFERARTELMRHLGYTYAAMEASGVMMPLIEASCRYHSPGRYDDLLTVKAIIKEMPVTRMNLAYEVRNEAGVLLCSGHTTLVFVNAVTRKPIRAPEPFLEALRKGVGNESPAQS